MPASQSSSRRRVPMISCSVLVALRLLLLAPGLASPASAAQSQPVLEESLVDQDVVPGDTVSLKCKASGHPLPQVTWLLDGQAVHDGSPRRLRTGDYVTRDSASVVSFVNISDVTVMDSGRYECTAANDVGSIVSAARLRVTGPPIVKPMANVSVAVGSQLLLDCPTAGHPIHNYTWHRGRTRALATACVRVLVIERVKGVSLLF